MIETVAVASDAPQQDAENVDTFNQGATSGNTASSSRRSSRTGPSASRRNSKPTADTSGGVRRNSKPFAPPEAAQRRNSVKSLFTRPVVAFDVDEVLGCYLEGCIEWHNKKFETNLQHSDFFSYNFCEVWGGTDDDALTKCTEYMLSDQFKTLKVMEGAVEAVQRLSKRFDLVVVTSRQNWIREETIRWLNMHFQNAFKQVLFGNHWVTDPNAKRMTKRELCESVGAIALIDDNPKYVIDAAAADQMKKAILFDYNGKNGWSKQFDCPDILKSKTASCVDWEQVCVAVENLA